MTGTNQHSHSHGEGHAAHVHATVDHLASEQIASPNQFVSLDPELATTLKAAPGDLLLIAPTPEAAPRCYSIGSSSRVGDSLIRLTVSLHHWRDSDGQVRVGAASGYLCHELPEGARGIGHTKSDNDK